MTIPIQFAIAGLPEPQLAWKSARPDLDTEPASQTSPITLLSDPGGA